MKTLNQMGIDNDDVEEEENDENDFYNEIVSFLSDYYGGTDPESEAEKLMRYYYDLGPQKARRKIAAMKRRGLYY